MFAANYKELLIELVKREIKAKYKQSILGYAWVILVPLINLIVLTVVFSFLVRIPTGGTPYPVFLFVGLVPWLFTANAITYATGSLVANSTLITKIRLPREVFPLASIFAKFIDFLLSILILVAILIAFGVTIHLTVLWVPIILFIQLLLIIGISFILSAINVFFRDVENVISVFITMWLYISPVLYPPELVPGEYRMIFNLNPMSGIINAYRNTVLYGLPPSTQSFLYATGFSLIIFIFGYIYFKKKSVYFADVV